MAKNKTKKKESQVEVNESNSKTKKTQKKKKRKLKTRNLVVILVMLIAFALVIYSAIYIIRWSIDNESIDKLSETLEDQANVQEIEDVEQTQVVQPEEEIPQTDPYWEYIKMKLIDVDFTELSNTNPETEGWIQVNGTNINYPFVQHEDNKYYLTHAFDKSYNGGGWVFLDYRNSTDVLDKNTIIYAHGRQNKTMFGSLKNILNSNWYNNKENHIIKLSTKTQNTLWQVFSVYRIPNTSDYLQTEFSTEDEFKAFADMLQNRSAVAFDTTVSKTDKILTLSTCWNDDEKVVMHAKMIKYSDR